MTKDYSVKEAFIQIRHDLQYRRFEKANRPQPITLELELNNLILTTMANTDQMKEAFKLRQKIFFNDRSASQLDIDKYDECSDHLIVFEKANPLNVKATTRLQKSKFAKNLYINRQFETLDLQKTTEFIEFGRMCFDQFDNSHLPFQLLWTGILHYMTRHNIKILLGYASIKNLNPRQTALVIAAIKSLEMQNSTSHFKTSEMTQLAQHNNPIPHYSYQMPFIDDFMDCYAHVESEKLNDEALKILPIHFQKLLHCGAHVFKNPSWDSQMNCVDFLIALDLEIIKRLAATKINML